jgi:hypothetical protein
MLFLGIIPLSHSLHPQAEQEATPIPVCLLDVLIVRLDVTALDKNGLRASTRCSYNSAKKSYMQFCHARDVMPTPATEHQLCQYVSNLNPDNLCHSIIKSYLSAIRSLKARATQVLTTWLTWNKF